jgi:hypothetical protein
VVLLGTAALSAPALSAIGAALGRRSRLAADLALVMAALAFGSLLLAACTPLVMLGRSIDLDYHRMILAVVAMFAIAGGAALRMIWRCVALEAAPGWRTAVVGLCVVFSLVGGQLSWALRPYLVRPRTPDVPFAVDRRSAAARVTVTNHGPALSPVARARVWDRFYSTRVAAGGSGLGLAIVRSVALGHGGTVGVDCTGGVTAFWLELPAPES